MQYRFATIRNTPLLVQIFIVYFGLASVGLKVDAFTAATAALVINVGAYTSEIARRRRIDSARATGSGGVPGPQPLADPADRGAAAGH